MSGYKLWDVLVPIKGHMRVYVRAENRREAEIQGLNIACDMSKEATDTLVPNLYEWYVDTEDKAIALERGEDDE